MLGGQARWKITSTAGGSVSAIFMGRYLAGHLYRLKRSIYFGPLILLLGRPPEDISGDVKKKTASSVEDIHRAIVCNRERKWISHPKENGCVN